MTPLEWLRNGLALKGKSQRGLAKHLGVDETIVSKMVSGKRKIQYEEISEIASYLGIPAPGQLTVPVRAVATIPVEAVNLALGMWREGGGMAIQDLPDSVPAIHDPRWAGLSQYAAFINGTRNYAVCIKFNQVRQQPLNGDTVHVKRVRGRMVEDTMRKVVIENGRTILRHESMPNGLPDHEVTYPSDQKDEAVQIEGLVVGVFHSLA